MLFAFGQVSDKLSYAISQSFVNLGSCKASKHNPFPQTGGQEISCLANKRVCNACGPRFGAFCNSVTNTAQVSEFCWPGETVVEAATLAVSTVFHSFSKDIL